MNDRVQSALKVLGIGVPPAATLEREGAFFALLDDTLIYQDAGGTRRVTLRDLTRIHSDEEGLLRVETPAGTALTASLLGYDPARVQAFFAGVRDATARAKHLPAAPLPNVSGQKTFGTSPSPAPPKSTPAPAVKPPREVPGQDSPARERPAPPAPSRATQWKPPSQNDLGGETVRVIGPSDRAQPPTPDPAPAPTSPAPAPEPAPASRPTRVVVSPTPVPPAPVTAPPEVVPVAPVDAAPEPPRIRQVPAPVRPTGLGSRAEGVQGWVGRLRLLAVVLGLAALGLAAFQFAEGARLTGLWTLIAGGVGALALLAFAEVADLVVALARTVAGEGGETDPGERSSGDATP